MKPNRPLIKNIIIPILFSILILIFPGNGLAIRDIPDKTLAYPALILLKIGNDIGTGSGFYYGQDDKAYLVTARHVLFNDSSVSIADMDKGLLIKIIKKMPSSLSRKIYRANNSDYLYYFGAMTSDERDEILKFIPQDYKILIHKIEELYNATQALTLKAKKANIISYPIQSSEKDSDELEIDLDASMNGGFIRYHKSRDIAVILLGRTENIDGVRRKIKYDENSVRRISATNLNGAGIPEKMLKKFDEVLVANEVYLFGYPTSLSSTPEIEIKRPLLRKGIVAGKNIEFQTIILDCPAYQGNSGGLVLEAERINISQVDFKAIGIISKFVPFIHGRVENSGYSIAEPIDGLIEILSEWFSE